MTTKIVTLGDNQPFDVEITGSNNATTGIIFVHGFGVKRDSRGLFTAIENQICSSTLSVRGDFSVITDDVTAALPFSAQANRLNKVVDYVRQNFGITKLVYIGHSQGCIVVAKTSPTSSQVILLAPPITSPAAVKFASTPGWSRPGSVLKIDGESILQRSDGSITTVGPDYWCDFKATKPEELYLELSKSNQVNVVLADADNVLGKQAPIKSIPYSSIKNADHDFSKSAREPLVSEVVRLLRLNKIT